jgi:hypothetical protein
VPAADSIHSPPAALLWPHSVAGSGLSRASIAGHYDAVASIYRRGDAGAVLLSGEWKRQA